MPLSRSAPAADIACRAMDGSSGTVMKWYGDGPRQYQSSPLNVRSRALGGGHRLEMLPPSGPRGTTLRGSLCTT